MEITINNIAILVNDECGMYKAINAGLGMQYAEMDPKLMANAINNMQRPDAIKAVTDLRDIANDQIKLNYAPNGVGHPILKYNGTIPIDDVRQYIQNTVKFFDDVLNALNGQ